MAREMAARRRGKTIKSKSRTREALGLIALAIGVFVSLALISYHSMDDFGSSPDLIRNLGGRLGAAVASSVINFTFGRIFAWVLPILVILWGLRIIRSQWQVIGIISSLKLLGLGILGAVTMAFISGAGWASFPQGADYEYAGWVGNALHNLLVSVLGYTGSGLLLALLIILWTIWVFRFRPSEVISGLATAVGIILAAGWTTFAWAVRGIAPIFRRRDQAMRRQKPLVREVEELVEPEESEDEFADTEPVIAPLKAKASMVSHPIRLGGNGATTGVYELPPLDLLNPPKEEGPKVDERELSRNAKLLETKLMDFGVRAHVVEVHPGPVITRYDLEPAPGVKVSRIVSLADDLTLALRAKAIRIIAPIPGEGAVGIEVPNPERVEVSIRSLLETPEFQSHASKLLFAVGKTTEGDSYLEDLARMPHLLIAGTTGSGKSVFLNSLIVSILCGATPDEVQFIMIDPKKLELSGYSELRNHHLVTRPDLGEDVVTSANGAVQILKSVELEMSRRYDLLAEVGSRNINEYNDRARTFKGEDAPVPLPFLVVVIDELADLMLLAAKEIEEPIAHLAQMSRAVGIHLVVATQRPSVDVITGVIKANFPCRVAFQVASKIDSRTILDMNGAETLLGRGDMLFIPPGQSIPARLHGAMISQAEINKIIAHIRKQPMPTTRIDLPVPDSVDRLTETVPVGDVDPLFEEAAKIVARTQQGSVSILQRRLKVGYARAARLIDQLERAGIVGPFDGSKAREVLVEEDYLANRDHLE
jgi:S-DNA-T family DNA segregation ATPase FtsK/SpoIIIE